MKTTVYALFVGINQYEANLVVDRMATFPALGGCVNDVTAVRNLLASQADLDLRALSLTDHQATKANIVEAFEKHLGQAGPNDVALFYYSGHGTVEQADPEIWTSETDARLEGIVCYYTENKSGKFLLADKELRYLLAELSQQTQAHIVAIFDCCHSGDNTRAAAGDAEVIRKQVDMVFPQRRWEDFIFSKKYQPAQFKGKGIDDVLPPGRYVQIAACESNESALEVRGMGVLTAHLLDALRQTGGNLTYRDLLSRIRNQAKYLFGQRPKLYTPPLSTELADLGFLKKPAGASATSATLIYNKAGEYRLDRGRLHRVEAGVTTVTTQGTDGQPVTGLVKSVEPDSAVVEFAPQMLGRIARDTQAATLANLSSRTLRLQLIDRDQRPKSLKTLLDLLNSAENAAYFTFEDDAAQADFSLVLWRNMYYITRPGDLFRPLALPVKADTKDAAAKLTNQLRHISQWKFNEELRNSGPDALPQQYLEVALFSVDGPNETPVTLRHDEAHLHLSPRPNPQGPGQRWGGALKVKLTNTSKADLYVAAVYCSYDFSCVADKLLNPAVVMLEPGESKFLLDHRSTAAIPLQLDETVRLFNWPESRETLKFVFSTENFDAAALNLSRLPAPAALLQKGGLDLDEEATEKGRVLRGWNTRDIKIVLDNPQYNRVDKSELEDYLQPTAKPETAHFMMGLYFENDGPCSGRLRLKPGMLASEKGFGWDLLLNGANKWSNYWRNRDYDQAEEHFPGKPKIVSEGDSWFQHPTIPDIIDHVTKFYPVHCVAAAGDTIRNWSREGKVLAVVEEINPAILLLSGGGNDILGESMLHFLADKFEAAAEGEQPERFFGDIFQPELKALIENYRTLFSYFKANRPQMPILVHGYDYPRPLEPASTKTSWLGKYLTEKKILAMGDRKAAIHYMMDQFNEKLAAAAAEFPDQVYYLDLRGVVRDDQWSDEIHPNADGFQDVSLKFIQKINALVGKG